MEFNFFGFHLELWKLHTATEYATFALCLAFGVVLLIWATKRMSKGRNDEAALKKVTKRLRRLGGRKSVILPATALPQGEGRADALFISQRGVFALRVLGWGYRASGSLRAREWRVSDAKEERFIANPYAQSQLASEAISASLREGGLPANVSPLVVFADPFNLSPRFSLEGGANTYGYADLKRWFKSRPKNALEKEQIDAIAHAFTPAHN